MGVLMPTPHEIAALDARILARHDELEQERGKPPTRQELGDDLGLSRHRVQSAFTRSGRRQRAPGAGRPSKDAPLIDVVIAVGKAALFARWPPVLLDKLDTQGCCCRSFSSWPFRLPVGITSPSRPA